MCIFGLWSDVAQVSIPARFDWEIFVSRIVLLLHRFQFLQGSIGRDEHVRKSHQELKFQFLQGSIGRKRIFRKQILTCVSIPARFDWEMRVAVSGGTYDDVSIPARFDWEEVFKMILNIIAKFQFLQGSIGRC